jgi:hypothetical protein
VSIPVPPGTITLPRDQTKETPVTTTPVHDPKASSSAPATLTPLPMAALAIAVWNLLDQAGDLPQPQMIDLYDTQHISFQFAPELTSLNTVARWARRFGGEFTSGPHQSERGPQTWCRTAFDYHGVTVDAYAHIPAEPATT